MVMPDDVREQTHNCFTTIGNVLAEAGFSLKDVVRATYYIVNRADADGVLAVCGQHFGDIRPAATLLIVAGLLKSEMKVEIEVTALRQG